jgi:ComF family protein
MKMNLSVYAQDVLGLFFPVTCLNCATLLIKSEKDICSTCFVNLPVIGHFSAGKHPIGNLFLGRSKLSSADAWLYFKKGGIAQKLIHELKYKNNYNLGVRLGYLYGQDLKNQNYIELPNLLTCVPMHPKKQRKRGYNPSRAIAEGLAMSLEIPLYDYLISKTQNNSSQTRKKRYERWENSMDSYSLTPHTLDTNRNIGIVDDVVTTGSTLEACAKKLNDGGFEKISLFALCLAIN